VVVRVINFEQHRMSKEILNYTGKYDAYRRKTRLGSCTYSNGEKYLGSTGKMAKGSKEAVIFTSMVQRA